MSRRPLLPAATVAVAAAAIVPFLRGNPAMNDTSIVIAIYALIALSVGVTYGLAGLLSVAQASFAAVGAYVTAILTVKLGWSPWATAGLAVIAPALLAYPLARVVTRLSPLALAIATLMFGYTFDIAVREGGDITGGYIGLSGIPEVPGTGGYAAYHGLAWAVVAIVLAGYGMLKESHFGSALRTIRHDALRAEADGVNVAHLRSLAMSISAAIAGAGGWLYAHHLSYLGPESLNPALSLSAILMAVIGGAHTLLGPVVGAALLTLIFHFIPGQEVVGIFYGSALIICLLIAPRGLMGHGRQLVAALRRAKTPTVPTLIAKRQRT